MKKNDNGLEELLELLRTHPGLIRELIFDRTSIQLLLKTKAARRLVIGVDTRKFLRYVAGPEDGYPIAQCGGGTKYLCAKGTQFGLGSCGGGTKPL